jgi:hypothetical protein
MSECIEQVAAEREDLVGISEVDAVDFRRYQPAPPLRQKFLPDAFLESTPLSTDGRADKCSYSHALVRLPARTTGQK